MLPMHVQVDANGMSPGDRREVRRILMMNLDQLAAAWRKHFGA